MRIRFAVTVVIGLVVAGAALAQAPAVAPRVHIVYMGGDDCPPCAAWRKTELPKLEKSELFRSVRFTYVSKMIRSQVPPSLFLPSEVRPYKDKLDLASGGAVGSPQTAIIVNDEVFDYYFGSRSAASILKMLEAIATGSEYPFERCLRITRQRTCEEKG
jgi:hypothetical protein